MNIFDEICAVQAIHRLQLARGVEKSPDEIKLDAREIARQHDMDLEDAYEAMEAWMLDVNPKPEDWR